MASSLGRRRMESTDLTANFISLLKKWSCVTVYLILDLLHVQPFRAFITQYECETISEGWKSVVHLI